MFVIRKSALIAAAIFFAAALFVSVGISKANAASEEYARYTVVLDAGHGGVDPGVLGVTTKTKESDINLAIVKKLAGYFSDAGFRVILTRKNEGGLYGLPTAVKKPVRKALYVVLGCIGLVLGAIGAILPMLPSFPFLMLTEFCFGRSSDRLNNWFKNTRLYKNNLESYVNGQGMTWRTKIRIMVMVTILMSIGFYIMFSKNLIVPCIVLGCVWLFHILYFCFGVKKYVPDKEV